MRPEEIAHKIDHLHDAAEPLYLPLARIALWVCGLFLAAIIMTTMSGVATHQSPSPDKTAFISMTVQACQVLSVISLALLGYKGSRRK